MQHENPPSLFAMLKSAGRFFLWHITIFGVLTRIYDNIRSNQIRKQIAKEFSLSVPVFMSWLTIVTVCRNNCCHHSRVWNRTFALRALSMRNMTKPWISVPVNQQKVFFSLCIIKYFLNIISPKNDMTDKLKNLLLSSPQSTPPQWDSRKVGRMRRYGHNYLFFFLTVLVYIPNHC